MTITNTMKMTMSNDDDGTVDDGGGKSAVYADGRYQAFEQPAKESKMVPRGSS